MAGLAALSNGYNYKVTCELFIVRSSAPRPSDYAVILIPLVPIAEKKIGRKNNTHLLKTSEQPSKPLHLSVCQAGETVLCIRWNSAAEASKQLKRMELISFS